MANISEHDSILKWERNHSEDCWVHLFIRGHPVGVHNLLKHPSDCIQFEHCRWLHCMV